MEGKSPCTSQQVVTGLFCITFKTTFKCVRFHVNGSNIPLELFGAWKLLFANTGFSSSWWKTCPEAGGGSCARWDSGSVPMVSVVRRCNPHLLLRVCGSTQNVMHHSTLF